MQPQISQIFFGESFQPRLLYTFAPLIDILVGVKLLPGVGVARTKCGPSAVGSICRQAKCSGQPLWATIEDSHFRQVLLATILGKSIAVGNHWATIVGNPNAAGNHCGQPSPQLFRS